MLRSEVRAKRASWLGKRFVKDNFSSFARLANQKERYGLLVRNLESIQLQEQGFFPQAIDFTTGNTQLVDFGLLTFNFP